MYKKKSPAFIFVIQLLFNKNHIAGGEVAILECESLAICFSGSINMAENIMNKYFFILVTSMFGASVILKCYCQFSI